MAVLIHPTRATHDIPHIGVRKGERMYHVLSDLVGPAGGRELRTFVRGCGMRPQWVQYEDTYREHFDAHAHLADCLQRRGARLVGNHEVGALLRAKRAAQTRPAVDAADGASADDQDDEYPSDADDDEDDPDVVPAHVRWGPVAGVLGEPVLRALGEVAGRDVLEIACGSGANSIALARQGARCVAQDESPRRLERARQRMAAAEVSFRLVQDDPRALATLEDASFDVVFSASGGLATIADLRLCLRAVARVLRPGGLCALAAPSPLFEIFPAEGTDQLHPARSYFDRAPLEPRVPGGATRFHRTVGDWVAAFAAAGLILTDALEPEPHPRLWRASARTNLPWEKVAMLPVTTIWRARKPPTPNAMSR